MLAGVPAAGAAILVIIVGAARRPRRGTTMTRTAARGRIAVLTALVLACAAVAGSPRRSRPREEERPLRGVPQTPDARRGLPRAGEVHRLARRQVAPELHVRLVRVLRGRGLPAEHEPVHRQLADRRRQAGKLGSKDKFTDNAIASFTVQGQKTTTRMRISGTFSTPKRVSGTITFSQTVVGGGVDSKCGPATPAFTARAQ